ncbi:hypothetical protein KW807_00070 [Candidatus Parcubacteria bacterium]|nr:hypothetical protein [Candidatus Parcubacteria bacterium]
MQKLCVHVYKLGVDPKGRKDPGIYVGPFETAEELLKWVKEAGFEHLGRGYANRTGYGVRDYIVQNGFVLHEPSKVEFPEHDYLPIFEHLARGGKNSS